MKRDVLFLGMDVNNETRKIFDEFKPKIVDGMNDEQLAIYNKGVEDVFYALVWILDRENLSDGENFIVHIDGFDHQEEFYKSGLFKLADKRGYEMLEVE